MTVDASHITLFSLPNREMIYQGNGGMYNDELQPVYGSKPEKDIPVAFPATVSRKRSRDSLSFDQVPFSVQNVGINGNCYGELTFLGEDVSSQMYQQQTEIDRLIAHHMENVRAEIEQIRKRNTRRLITAIHESITKRLKTKEEERLKIGRLNYTLEEKVKSLTIENQILKELVQTNEATANTLRNKLQQVLAQVQQQQCYYDSTILAEDVQSCCGSNNNIKNGGGERKANDINENDDECDTRSRYGRIINRWCRRCEREEACVLLLPCRHLCVCTLCVESISFCPVCNAIKSAGVHVNLSLS